MTIRHRTFACGNDEVVVNYEESDGRLIDAALYRDSVLIETTADAEVVKEWMAEPEVSDG